MVNFLQLYGFQRRISLSLWCRVLRISAKSNLSILLEVFLELHLIFHTLFDILFSSYLVFIPFLLDAACFLNKIQIPLHCFPARSETRLYTYSCGLQTARFLCPWDSPGKNTRVGCHALLHGIFLTQESNPGLLHCRQTLYPLSHQGSLHIFLIMVNTLVASNIEKPRQHIKKQRHHFVNQGPYS